MAMATRRAQNMYFSEKEHFEKTRNHVLYDELIRGMQSVKDGDVYTLEEAWKEIDKI